jgi:hypothetical protein
MRRRRTAIALTIIGLIAIPFMIWGWDQYQDRQVKVKVDSATSLYASEVDAAYGSQRPLKELKPGDKLKVKRTTYGKDYWALQVETDDGFNGWVASGEKGLTIERRK